MESSKNQPTIPKELLDLEQVIFDIKKENIESSVNRTIDLFDSNNPNSFNSVICLLVISAFMAQRADESIYFDYLLLLQEREEEKHIGNLNVIEIIKKVLVRNKINESYYLLEKMIERNLITTFDVRHVKSNYFIHYFVQRPNKEKIYEDEFYDIFKKDLKIVSKNNWELHKKYVKEGINPSEIAKAIRNDEIEKLQEISSQSDFDFNQTIEPSVYERFSYVNRENVSLIDYAAFFGSIKCFKYLLLNGSNLINTFQFAVAGGNLEIINLCEQNHSDDSGIINAAITFHRNDILRYFYENKFDEVSLNHEEKVNPAENTFLQIIYRLHLNKKSIHKEKEPLVKAIKWSNYEFLEFLKEEEDNLNLGVFPSYCKLSIEMGNLYLLKYFLEIIPIPDDILLWSAISWNAEIIKLFIDKKAFNINETDYHNMNPLLIACKHGNSDVVKIILENKRTNIKVKNWYGENALTFAIKSGSFETVKYLLDHGGFDLNIINKKGMTPLIEASDKGYDKIVKLLLEQKGININAKDNSKETALFKASTKGYVEIVELLLKQEGIDINAKNWVSFWYL